MKQLNMAVVVVVIIVIIIIIIIIISEWQIQQQKAMDGMEYYDSI